MILGWLTYSYAAAFIFIFSITVRILAQTDKSVNISTFWQSVKQYITSDFLNFGIILKNVGICILNCTKRSAHSTAFWQHSFFTSSFIAFLLHDYTSSIFKPFPKNFPKTSKKNEFTPPKHRFCKF